MRNVTKYYGDTLAVANFSMELPSGQVMGLLGENGAGKTTLMNILAGYLPATSGDVVINGAEILTDPIGVRKSIGYMPEQVAVYPELTVREFLAYCCALKSVDNRGRASHIAEIAHMAGIGMALEKRISTLSKGMKQRVGLAQALCGMPQLLLLDEPTAGFDPVQAAEFRSVVRSLARDHTVIVSSHILSEIAGMCDRVGIMRAGKLVYDQPIRPDAAAAEKNIRIEVSGKNGAFLSALRALPSVIRVTQSQVAQGERYTASVSVHDEITFGREIASLLSGLGMAMLSLEHVERTLEDIFLTVSRGDRIAEGKPIA